MRQDGAVRECIASRDDDSNNALGLYLGQFGWGDVVADEDFTCSIFGVRGSVFRKAWMRPST